MSRIRKINLVVLGLIVVCCVTVGCANGADRTGPIPESSDQISQDETPTAISATIAKTATATLVTSTAEPSATKQPTDVPTTAPVDNPTIEPTANELLLPVIISPPIPVIEAASCVPRNTPVQKGLVVNIVDGDTIDVKLDDGSTARVRYIGMDTPERDRPLYDEAKQANSELVLQKEVLLIQDVSDVDGFDRLLRYVIADDVFVNQELVRLGLANAESYPPDSACDSTLSSAQTEAQASLVGLWVPTSTPAPSAPIVEIIDVNKRDEYVDIQNMGNGDVNLSGWLLVSEKGNQSCPLSGTLKAGETLRIWAMESQGDGFSCGFNTNIWNNSEPDPAVLYNPHGIEVSRK